MASSVSTTSLLPSEPLPWRPNTRPKLPPGALLDIDQGPMYDILTEWLPFKSVCHLDSALCQRWRRAEFLTMLSTKVLLFNREDIRILTYPKKSDSPTHRALGAAALNWVLKRGIHLASLQLPCYGHRIKADEKQSIVEALNSLALNGRLDKLETISLRSCSFIEDADLAVVLSKCYSSVKSIGIEGCGITESAATHIKRCTKLEALTANGNESAADMVEIFQQCKKLRKINLNAFGTRLTDEVLQSMAVNCTLLEHLNLTSCSNVTDEAFRRVSESCPLLQYVDLCRTSITSVAVVALCNGCPILKRLILSYCRNLTDAAILAVAERLPGLTHIDLHGIVAITSSAVETLASKCRDLEFIDLEYCPNVTDATLSTIAEYCSKLRELSVVGCRNVTAEGVAKIRSKFSKLIVHRLSH